MNLKKLFSTRYRCAIGSLTLALLTACDAGVTARPQSTETTSAQAGNWVATVEVANPSAYPRTQENLLLSFYSLGLPDGDPAADSLVVRAGQQLLPSQAIDSDADGKRDGLLVQVDFAAAEHKALAIMRDSAAAGLKLKKRTLAEISHKVDGQWRDRKYIGGHFQNVSHLSPPQQHTDHSEFIRYEGPGIESDRVGYRVYLDWRNGFDIFGKKTDDMVLPEVGRDGYESYHHMADWGMDILKVGASLGAGGYGYWNGKTVERVSEVEGWDADVIENGDLYSSLKIAYKNWTVNNRTVDLNAQLAMSAGSRLVHAQLDLSERLANLAIGIGKSDKAELIVGNMDITGRAYTYIATYGRQSLSGDNLGIGLIFQKERLKSLQEDEHNHVAVMKPAGGALDYYFLAAWEGEKDGITSKEEFVRYLDREVERLTVKPRQRIKTAIGEVEKAFPVTAESALAWSARMADSELQRKALLYAYDGYDVIRNRDASFEYTTGLLMQAYDDLAAVKPDADYGNVAEQVIGSFIAEDGKIRTYKRSSYNIDSINSGKMVLRLYEKTRDEKYRRAAKLLRQQLAEHPRTSGGAFWHKKRYPHQLWLDGVYMAMPFLAHYSTLFESGAGLDEIVNEFKISRAHLRDSDTGLYYHAWDEKKQQDWADPETGLSKYFWGRGLGWLAMAIVDVLDYVPAEDVAHRQPLIDMLNELAPSLVKYQDPATGVWFQIIDQPQRPGNYRESSASAMFVYALAKGVNRGYLPAHYKETAVKGYEGLIREFVNVHPDGRISFTNICLVAGLGYGRDGSYTYYMSEPVFENDPKGVGPFMAAGVQVSELLHSAN